MSRNFHQIEGVEDDTAGLLILNHNNKTIHRALGLGGAPVAQAATPAASGDRGTCSANSWPGYRTNLYTVLKTRSGQSATPHSISRIFFRLPSIAFGNLIIRVKQLFSSQDPWVQAFLGRLGTLLEVRGVVEIRPIMILHGTFKYP